ncbi:MAG: type I-C CRISPR-associated endonuclease Cas1c [Thermodesulfobacteriota bacterium]
MKRLLNTLYVTSQGAYLSRDGETVLVQVESETKLRLPIHTLDGIVCFGRVLCSPFLMGLCGERNVTLSFLTERGRFLARVHGPVSGNVLLRREQYRRADDPESCADIAKAVVLAKISNSRSVLLRAVRDHSDKVDVTALSDAARELSRIGESLDGAVALDTIRGREGEAARIYFEQFDQLIVAQKEDFYFRERSRRPPLDNMNALLSFLYTLVTHDVVSALEAVGLDPAVGYLHRDRPGRPGLALDLVEEFRPFLADRLALSLVNRQQLKDKDFAKTESGAVRMSDEARKKLLQAYQERKQEKILHPFIEDRVPIGLLPHVQAMLFARYLRGDLDGYPPFFWR